MKPIRIVLAAFAAVLVAGAVAQAARQQPTPTPVSHARPATILSSSGTDSTDPGESEPAGPSTDGTGPASAAVPDFTACAGLTGLDNAICHVQANNVAHPNTGLANALSHLQANQAAQASRLASASASSPGNSAVGLAHAPTGVVPGS